MKYKFLIISLDSFKIRHLKKYLFLLLLQTWSPQDHLFAFYEDVQPDKYLISVWTVENGLPQNTIQALVQTYDGFIWIGTPSGLVRFDGLNFKLYNRWNSPALKSDNITSLYEDQNKTLWIGTEGGGLCALKSGKLSQLSTKDGLSSDDVRAILSDQKGDLWVGTDYGLNRINRNGIKVFTTEDGLYDNIITSLTVDSWNNLWIGTYRGGLVKYHQEIVGVYSYQEGLKNLSVRSLFADERGIIWIGTNEGMYYIDRDTDIVHNVPGTYYTPITALRGKSANNLWIGTMVGGLKQMNLQDMTRETVTDLLPDDYIHCLLVDNANNVWIGTDTGGLVQLRIQRIFNITENEGLPDNAISAVFEDRSKTTWIGTRNEGLVKYRAKQNLQIFNKKYGLSSDRISVISEDNQGQIWIGTEDQGINILKRNVLLNKITADDGLSSNHITTILQDYQGDIWIGTASGLNRYRNGKISKIKGALNHPNPMIRVLLKSQSKLLYVGTNEGVYTLSENELTPLDQNSSFEYDVISLYKDQFGALWIGTNGDGLFRWVDGLFDTITKADGLPDNFILSIQEDEKSNLWMSSHSGVFYVRKRDITSFFENEISKIQATWFTETEGMASRQCTGWGQPSVFKCQDGRLLYPTVNGVSIIDPLKIKDYCTIPIVSIENVVSVNDTVSVQDQMIPVLSRERITFAFTATELAAPDKISFKYILEGYDQKFRYLTPGDEKKVDYNNLSSGDHTFLIWGINNEGGWGEQAATFSFRINPPIYLNPFYMMLFIAVSLSISTAVIYINHKRIKQKKQDKYKTSRVDPGKIAEIANRLDGLMNHEKLYLNPDLTLNELAHHLKMHSNYISQIINEHFGIGYNDFINKYRVEEVKKRFENPDYQTKTVLEIIYETGFYSKSVFNSAFKKFTGMTPTEYRKKSNKLT